MKIQLDKGAKIPQKAFVTDAGFDLCTPIKATIKAHDSIVIDTGVHMEIPFAHVGMLKSKSGLNVKHGIVSEGVIDCCFTGAIKVKLYNHSNEDYTFEAGDKITQIVIIPIPIIENNDLVVVDELSDTVRGNNGFGSTGR